MKRETIIKIIAFKLGFDRTAAESIADDMISDDFPKNGIKTMGQAIGYLEHIRALLEARRGA